MSLAPAAPADDDRDPEFDAALCALRNRIDMIDTQLLGLFNARAAVVAEVYELKRSRGMRRLDRARTRAILDRLAAESGGPLAAEDVRALFEPVLKYFVEHYAPPDEAPAKAPPAGK